MHDKDGGFLDRTTDVKKKFPSTSFLQSNSVTLNELQVLNAGEWFIEVRTVLIYAFVPVLKS